MSWRLDCHQLTYVSWVLTGADVARWWGSHNDQMMRSDHRPPFLVNQAKSTILYQSVFGVNLAKSTKLCSFTILSQPGEKYESIPVCILSKPGEKYETIPCSYTILRCRKPVSITSRAYINNRSGPKTSPKLSKFIRDRLCERTVARIKSKPFTTNSSNLTYRFENY